MNDVHLRLSLDETNLILEALGNLSFIRVYGVISKIQSQARDQSAAETAGCSEVEPTMPADRTPQADMKSIGGPAVDPDKSVQLQDIFPEKNLPSVSSPAAEPAPTPDSKESKHEP